MDAKSTLYVLHHGWPAALKQIFSIAATDAMPRFIVPNVHAAAPPELAIGGASLFEQVVNPLQRLFDRKGRGCRVVLATNLRNASRHTVSSAMYHNVQRARLPWWLQSHQDVQTGYILANDSNVHTGAAFSRAAAAREVSCAAAALSHMDLIGRTEELSSFVHALRRVLAPNATAADRMPPLGYRNPSGLKAKEGVQTFGPSELNASELELVAAASRGDDALYRRFCRKNCTDMVGVPWVGTARSTALCRP